MKLKNVRWDEVLIYGWYAICYAGCAYVIGACIYVYANAGQMEPIPYRELVCQRSGEKPRVVATGRIIAHEGSDWYVDGEYVSMAYDESCMTRMAP